MVQKSTMETIRPAAPPQATGADISALALSSALPGERYHLETLGQTRDDRLEMMAAGLSQQSVIEVLAGAGTRPRVVACGEIRAAIGHDLATRVNLRRCGRDCGCRRDGGH